MFDKPSPALPGTSKAAPPSAPDTEPEDMFDVMGEKRAEAPAAPVVPEPPSQTGALVGGPAPKKRGKFLFSIAIAALAILILALGGAVAYSYFWDTGPSFEELEGLDVDTPDPAQDEAATQAEDLIPQERDADSDGLTDDEERSLGTNPRSHDSDSDGLFDFDEAYVYETDPLDPDSDSDGFLDGEEVKNGYDPMGPGKLFEIPDQE